MLVPVESYEYGLTDYPGIDADGFIAAPIGPGLGATIDWDYVDNHTTSRF